MMSEEESEWLDGRWREQLSTRQLLEAYGLNPVL
mgnify:CR=1 FL=1